MYLNLGSGVLIPKDELVGIFDLDKLQVGSGAMEFLNYCEKNKKVTVVGDGIPKAFVLTAKSGDFRVYITTISASSIKGRWEQTVM